MTTLTQAAFARLCKVNRSSVSRAVKRGRLVLTDGMVAVPALADPAASLEERALSLWLTSASADPHHQARLQQLQEAREKKAALQQTAEGVADPREDMHAPQSMESINLRIKRADAVKRENEARKSEIERLAMEGEYLLKEAVDYALRDHTAVLRRELENLADRLAPVVHPLETAEEIHAAIGRAAEEVLKTLHHSMVQAKDAARELK